MKRSYESGAASTELHRARITRMGGEGKLGGGMVSSRASLEGDPSLRLKDGSAREDNFR
jgi:hypothetical protein